jgi:hypothetical protein
LDSGLGLRVRCVCWVQGVGQMIEA